MLRQWSIGRRLSLVTLMVLDYLLGFCRAWCECRISARKRFITLDRVCFFGRCN